jgi:hypothetical protein
MYNKHRDKAMYITRIYLKGFKHLALSNIKELEYRTDTPLQLILGGNGSGKSSILRELSPLPAIASYYHPGGVKEIDIQHNGSEYKLRSIINGTAKHSFIKDGVELNPGNGTGVVQKELVEREFNYTPLIQKILTGEMSFTSMAPNQRRELLTTISDLKLDYVLGFFNKLKQAHRDTVGAIKHVTLKQSNINTELLSMGDMSKLEEEAVQITADIRKLIPQSVNHAVYPEAKERKLMDTISNFESHLNELLDTRNKSVGNGYGSLESVEALLDINAKKTYAIEEDIKNTLNSISDISELADIVENTDNGIDTLTDRKATLEVELKNRRILDGITYVGELKDVLPALSSASKDLYELWLGLSDDMIICNREEYTGCVDAVNESKQSLNISNSRINDLKIHLDKAIRAKDNSVTCPKCQTLFSLDKNSDVTCIETLKSKLVDLGNAHESIAKDCKVLEDKLYGYETYIRYFKQIQTYVLKTDVLLPMWNHFKDIKNIVDKTPNVVDFLRTEYIRIENNLSVINIQKEISEIDKVLGIHKLAETTNVCQKKASLEERLDGLYASKDALVIERKKALAVIMEYERLLKIQDLCEAAAMGISKEFAEWVESNILDSVSSKINLLQGRLATVQSILRKKETLVYSLNDLTQSNADLLLENKAYAAIMDELSPTEGLIAEQMHGYMECFMDQVNSVIASVWEYEMSVKVCGFEENGLDYKFPLNVQGELVPEIKMGSKGQTDIIDFAFTVVTMGYLGLQDYPLYMDEIGASFDHKHRSNLIQYIKRLLESRQCAQLFMVNHYSQMYGGLASTNILVLSEDGIITPDTYNTHTRILYA